MYIGLLAQVSARWNLIDVSTDNCVHYVVCEMEPPSTKVTAASCLRETKAARRGSALERLLRCARIIMERQVVPDPTHEAAKLLAVGGIIPALKQA